MYPVYYFYARFSLSIYADIALVRISTAMHDQALGLHMPVQMLSIGRLGTIDLVDFYQEAYACIYADFLSRALQYSPRA